MTHEEAIALRPARVTEYRVELVFCIAGVLLFAYVILFRPNLHILLPAVFFLLTFLLGASQASERLFWPIHAAQRTANLSERTRSVLEFLRLTLPVPVVACLIVGLVRGFHSAWWLPFGWSLWIYPSIIADLLGERNFSKHARKTVGPYTWRDNLKPIPREQFHIAPSNEYPQPIHSDHWGDR